MIQLKKHEIFQNKNKIHLSLALELLDIQVPIFLC